MFYFAYGSNLNQQQMQNRCPDSVPVAKVKLKGYRLAFNRVADIVKKEGAVTWGAIYTVSPGDIKNLDRYEGYPRVYTKLEITVEDEAGTAYPAFAYLMAIKGCKEPSESYYGIIEEGYHDWGLPPETLREALKRSR